MRTTRPIPTVKAAIVVGVDGSRAGAQALDWAADQAALQHRTLVLVAAPDTSDADEASQRALERHPGLVVTTCVATEDPAPELQRWAVDAHLVVVGSRGSSLLRHLPTWQVGARVARRAAAPVVVVPAHNLGTVRRGVLAGVDLSERSEPVLRFAYAQASLHHQPLTVAHFARDRRAHQDADRLLAETVAGLCEDFPDVHTTLRVIHGSPSGHLLRMADQMHLLVVGQHHELGAYESPIGHVHASLVDRSPCPVAVVPVERPAVTLAR